MKQWSQKWLSELSDIDLLMAFFEARSNLRHYWDAPTALHVPEKWKIRLRLVEKEMKSRVKEI